MKRPMKSPAPMKAWIVLQQFDPTEEPVVIGSDETMYEAISTARRSFTGTPGEQMFVAPVMLRDIRPVGRRAR